MEVLMLFDDYVTKNEFWCATKGCKCLGNYYIYAIRYTTAVRSVYLCRAHMHQYILEDTNADNTYEIHVYQSLKTHQPTGITPFYLEMRLCRKDYNYFRTTRKRIYTP